MFELLYPGSPAPVLPKQVAGVSEEAVVNAAEMLPIVRENGLVYAQATRAYCHGGSMLLHPVVHLHIINRFDQLYLQKQLPQLLQLFPQQLSQQPQHHLL